MKDFNGIAVPEGETVVLKDGRPQASSRPIIPFIEGDGIGAEITAVARNVMDAAVKNAYGSSKRLVWYEIFAGDKSQTRFSNPLPEDTLDAIRHFKVAIKGPLGTPTGGGMRSLNVTARQKLDLFQCVRPVRYFNGVASVVLRPQDLDIVIFRENTEDVYAGIEFKHDSDEATKLRKLLSELGYEIGEDAGIGIKPVSKSASKRLIRAAIKYAIEHGRKVVTLMHKGNIQKYTEGAFRNWGYELATEEFADQIVTEADLWSKHNGKLPEGKILLNDRIADNMFCEVLTKASRYSVIATTNLNGDYISDATAAQVGGLGIAPGANIGDDCAIFEATHGTAPDIAGQNKANPCSLLISGVMMLEYLGWDEAAKSLTGAIETAIANKTCTFDLASKMENATSLSTTEFGEALIKLLPAKVEEKAAEKEVAAAVSEVAPAVTETASSETKTAPITCCGCTCERGGIKVTEQAEVATESDSK